MKKCILGLFVLAMFSITAFAKDKATNDGVLLKADYSAKQQWKYTVEYTSQWNFRQKSSNTAKATEIHCILMGAKKDLKKLSVKADSITVKSDVYSADLQKEIRDKLSSADYSLSLANGFPSIDTSVEMPANS
jgi:hypothetical protein